MVERDSSGLELPRIVGLMQSKGAKNVLIKPLANNDNSKQQIYLGGDFSALQALPSGKSTVMA